MFVLPITIPGSSSGSRHVCSKDTAGLPRLNRRSKFWREIYTHVDNEGHSLRVNSHEPCSNGSKSPCSSDYAILARFIAQVFYFVYSCGSIDVSQIVVLADDRTDDEHAQSTEIQL